MQHADAARRFDPRAVRLATSRRPARGADHRGNVVTNAAPGTITKIDRFSDIILRRGKGAEFALDIVAADPGCLMARACAAIFLLLSDTRPTQILARRHLEIAASTMSWATPREQLLIGALLALVDDRPRDADQLFLDLARVAPSDLLSAYVAHLHFLNHGRFDEMLELARCVHAADRNDGFALGMLSFALEEAGQFGAAENAGRAACALESANPWAHHALAHVFASRDRAAEGIDLLGRFSNSWDDCGPSMYTHNWWHAMILRLMVGDGPDVLRHYDQRIAPFSAASPSSFANAASMLARLELRGVDIGFRWHALADDVPAWIGDHVLPFLDLHYALALARAERRGDIVSLRRQLENHVETTRGGWRDVWLVVGLPLIDAVIAFGFGDVAAAREVIARVGSRAVLIGGSNAQRSLLREIADPVPISERRWA